MGRRKIEIKPIRDDRNRSVTFLKRKGGLFKKAHELSVLCSVDVAVVIFGHNKKLYEYSSSDINEIVGRFQYYGGAHEHKGPADFAGKGGGGDDDDEDDGGDEGDDRGGTPQPPDQAQMMAMQNHPGFQHVRHGTPSGSPPMQNGPMPQQFQRVPSPLPPGVSRPSSRASQHQGHVRRTSSNLVPPQHQQHVPGSMPQANYAYTPNPPFYNPQAAQQMQRPPGQPGPHPQGATYPPPYPPQGPQHPQMQAVMMQDNRRSSMPPAFPPQPPPQAQMQRQDGLQPPQQHPQPGHPSPRLQQQQRATPSPQPPQQQQFASPQPPQPRPLPAHAKSQSIFTPIDDSRSMLAQHWGSTSNASIDPAIKAESIGGPRAQSVDVGAVQRDKDNISRSNGVSPRPPPARPGRSPQPPPGALARTASTPTVRAPAPPSRTNTNQSDAKRPRLKVQIPLEASDNEAGATGEPETGQEETPAPSARKQDGRVVLPPPSPSAAGALLSAGAQGPPNPFARPAMPPMSTNPHAVNRDALVENQTPISALPSRFMSNELLPSPSTFYPEWGFGSGRSAIGDGPGSGMGLPSPLQFQTPVVGWNGSGREEESRKREREANAEDEGREDAKRGKP